jgi:hypothetical protein
MGVEIHPPSGGSQKNRTKHLTFPLFDSGTSVVTGDGVWGIPIDASMDGYKILNATAVLHTKGITGTTDIQFRRRRAGVEVDILSTKITIGDEFFASDGVIDTDNNTLAEGDLVYCDVDLVHSGTAPVGMSTTLECREA